MALGGGKREWSLIQNEGEIVTVLELQQHRLSLFWTSDGPKGELGLAAAETFNRKGRKEDRKGR
jgi:hypothetical protein